MNGIVTVVGSLNLDRTIRVATHPKPGETVLGSGLTERPGGKGANQAVAAARAGAPVRMIGRVGDDPAGRRYRDALRHHDIDTSAVLLTPGHPTGTAHITVDDHGENTITVVPGANAALTPHDVTQAAAAIRTAAVLLLQLETPLPAVLQAAHLAAEAGVRIILNASPATTLPDELIQAADLLIVNEHESRFLPTTARSVCVTLGARGAQWGEDISRPPRVEAIDTTGAGDSFAGTLAAHLAAGTPAPDALQAAVRAAATATTWPGAQEGELPP
ncbi:ribokinase [Actinokineospora enzanensis]|uniref:ribokinase n=1 Tax=Actinokineospora enzanensis TaxID=155975 RepID=UPI0003669C91|nr:ribokinase [Actinokineospora enzanensis]